MKLKAKIASLDQVAEPLRQFYVKADSGDGFLLDAEGVEDVTGLKNALEAERTQNKTAIKFYNEHKDFDFEGVGKTSKEVERLKTQLAEAKAGNSSDVEQLKARHQEQIDQMRQENEKALAQQTDQLNSLNGEIKKLMVTDQLRAGIGDKAINPDAADWMINALQNEFDVVEEGGQRFVRVKGENGPKMTAKGYMTMQERLESALTEQRFAPLLKGSGASGSGAQGSGAGGPGVATKRSEMSAPDRVAYIDKHGKDAYLNLPE